LHNVTFIWEVFICCDMGCRHDVLRRQKNLWTCGICDEEFELAEDEILPYT